MYTLFLRQPARSLPGRLKALLFSRFVLTTLLATLLAGCATPRAPMIGNEGFVLSGRLSARYADPDSDKKGELYGRFDWLEQGENTELTLIDPLGQAVARINANRTRTTITLRNGESYSDKNAEALTKKTLGWSLPLTNLGHWLRNRAGSAAEVERDAAGHILRIREDGWTIRYTLADDEATDKVDGKSGARTSRIDLSYPGPGPAIELRLALDP